MARVPVTALPDAPHTAGTGAFAIWPDSVSWAAVAHGFEWTHIRSSSDRNRYVQHQQDKRCDFDNGVEVMVWS